MGNYRVCSRLQQSTRIVAGERGKLLQNLISSFLVFNNRLESLPDSVGNLQNLLGLWVFNNRLESLPDSVGNLQNLLESFGLQQSTRIVARQRGKLTEFVRSLCLQQPTKSLPDSVGQLHNLQAFYAWNNTLTTLPKQ